MSLGSETADDRYGLRDISRLAGSGATMRAMTDAGRDRSHLVDRRPAHEQAQLELRASDADRDRAAAVLGSALAAGRLTTTEYAQRLDAVYTATILGELVPLTRDLPADNATNAGAGAADRAQVAARFSKVIRSGRWVAGRAHLADGTFRHADRQPGRRGAAGPRDHAGNRCVLRQADRRCPGRGARDR